jgi:8-oxo-dGTP diphosphatase
MAENKPTIRVVAAVIAEQGRYLITQRRRTAVLPLLWEFPGGRVEPTESDAVALARELEHRLEVTIEVGQLMSFVNHPYERYAVDLFLYECKIAQGTPTEKNVNAFRWVKSDEFDLFEFTPADEVSMSQLLGLLDS